MTALLVGVGLLLLAFGRRRAPAVRPETLVPPPAAGDEPPGLSAAARRVWARWGTLLRQYPAPIPPGLAAEICATESGGNPRAVVAPRAGGQAFWEIGLFQAVVEPDGNGEPRLHDFDPFDAASSVWGFQQSCARFARLGADWCRAQGREVYDDPPSAVWWAILSRSIGLAGVKSLVARSPDLWDGAGSAVAFGRLLQDRPERVGAIGVQSSDKVRMRVARATERASRDWGDPPGGPAPDRDASIRPWNPRLTSASSIAAWVAAAGRTA